MSLLPINELILPPYYDYYFKAIMTHPGAKPALMDLISSAIGKKVLHVEIRNNELPVTGTEEKL